VELSRRVAFFHASAPSDVKALRAASCDSSVDADAQFTLTEGSECGLLQPHAGRWSVMATASPSVGSCEVVEVISFRGVLRQLDSTQSFAGGSPRWSVMATTCD